MITEMKGWKRDKPGLGLWKNRGKVSISGLGHSDIDRRWDGKDMSKTLGQKAIDACNRALVDAGITVNDVDGMFCCPDSMAGFQIAGAAGVWGPRPFFAPPYDTEDGLSHVTNEWLMKNMGIKNVNCAPKDVPHLNESVGMAAEAIAQGLCHTALVVYTGANFEGRYRGGGENAAQFAKGGRQFNAPWGNHGGYDFVTILPHAMYNMKYGGTHEDMGPMVVNQHRNGRMTPWAFYVNQAANEPMLTLEDYVTSRYILKPLRLWDCDRPIHCVTAYVFTTAERAKTMRQKPVYVLGHSQHNYPVRSTHCTLEEMEGGAALAAQMIYEASGLNAKTLDVFNPYDGYATMVQFWLEGFGWHGVKKGEAYDFWKGDNIRVEGPHPFSSGGGNLGCGRTRSSFYTDAVEQLRGRVGIMEGFNDPVKHRPMAGKRKVNVKAETAVCFFSPVLSGGCLALGTSPD